MGRFKPFVIPRSDTFLSKFQKHQLILPAILALGFGLRLWGIDFGLPYLYHADEGVPVSLALRMIHTGDFNPKYFYWPSLFFYLNALVYFAYFALGKFTGRFSSPADLTIPDIEAIAVGKADFPEELLLGRGLTVLFGGLCVLLVYLICCQVYQNRIAGWVAALWLAVEPVGVINSHYIRPDVPATFFGLVSVLFAIKILDDPRQRNYILAALGAAFAISSKYNLFPVLVPIVVAHGMRFGVRGFFRKEIFAAGLAASVAFFLTTPFAILNLSEFLNNGPLQASTIYATLGDSREKFPASFWYLGFLWQTLGLVLLLALAGIFQIISSREPRGIVLISFPFAYFVLVNLYKLHFDTTILPIIPWLIVLAALFAVRISEHLSRWITKPIWRTIVFLGTVTALALPMFSASAASDVQLVQLDGREMSRRWIEENIPPGSRFVIEPYSPYLDRKKFVVEGTPGLHINETDWYALNGFEYLVFSQMSYQRMYNNPVRYASQLERYNQLFAQLKPIARFGQKGSEILLYKTAAVLPPYRVGARFGDYGDVIELIGYDEIPLSAGSPLRIKLYWRPLRAEPEPLAMEARLLGAEDQAIAMVNGDLFQGRGWQREMFAVEWAIPLLPNRAAAPYRVVVDVIQTRYAYKTPARNWADQRMDEVNLGPF